MNPQLRTIHDKLICLEKPDRIFREGCIPSAVLVILLIKNDKLHLLFTHRTKRVKNHKDQVSFPGGVQEEGDIDLIQTVIRETHEEIGIQFFRDEVVCQLPDVISPSSFQITPFVGIKEKISDLKINEKEVLNIFTIPYDWLADSHNWAYEKLNTIDGIRHVVVFNTYKGEKVWGLTAQIIINLVKLINI